MTKLTVSCLFLLSFVATPIAELCQVPSAKSGLEMFVSPRSSSVCVGDKELILDVLVVNEGVGNEAVDIATYHASVGFSTIANGTEGDGGLDGTTIIPDRLGAEPQPHSVILKPHEAFQTQLSLSLEGPFFAHAGLYRALPSLTLGNLQRPASVQQGFIFELRNCPRALTK